MDYTELPSDARTYFPRGLIQPEGSFRFSIDALLLARFAARSAPYQCNKEPADTVCCSAGSLVSTNKKSLALADLGTGCGVIALNMLLDDPLATAVGFDISSELIGAASANAVRLGVEDRFSGVTLDIGSIGNKKAPTGVAACRQYIVPESYDIIVSNPPYRKENQGRLPEGRNRTRALFETEGTLCYFTRASAYLLKNKGKFFCVYPAERMAELVAALHEVNLMPKRIRPVYSKLEKQAVLILVEARKNGNNGMTLEPPLVLYSGQGNETRMTDSALEFCPALACNAG